MKKYLIVTLHDGREIKRDISTETMAPIGSPANHEAYARLCQFTAMNGISDNERCNETMFTIIAPAAIKTVQVKFEGTKMFSMS